MNALPKLLHLEHDRSTAEMAAETLKAAVFNCQCWLVTSKHDFLRALNDFRPDAILANFVLPNYDGIAALNDARRLIETVPVVLYGDAIGEDCAVELLKAGATDFFSKDRMDRLPQILRRALREAVTQRQAEEATAALIVSEAHSRQLLELLPDAVVSFDSDGRIDSANQGAAAVFGRSDLVGQKLLLMLSEPAQRELQDQMQALMLTPGLVLDMELQVIRANGEKADLQARARRLSSASGQDVRFVAVFRDVTASKRDQLERYRSQRLEALGQLAAGLAHDFSNILTAVLGFADFALHQLPADHAVREDLLEIKTAGMRGAAMTRQLLAFARRQTVEPQAIDPAAALDQLAKMLRRLIGDNIELNVNVAPETKTCQIDPVQFDQILINLAVNARDAMPRGGVLNISASNRQVDRQLASRCSGVASGDYVCLEVSDSGEGIPPALQDKIFEPFFTTKAAGEGTGLGLSIVFGIVRQAGGFIEFDGQPGRGALFRIWLPHKPASASADQPNAPAASAGLGETILVADDDPAVRLLLGRLLERAGYKVLSAANGRDAIGLFHEHRQNVKLVVTDIVMPLVDGQALLQQLRSIQPDLRSLFLTGYPSDEYAALLKRGEGLAKPFSREVLLRTVRHALDKPS